MNEDHNETGVNPPPPQNPETPPPPHKEDNNPEVNINARVAGNVNELNQAEKIVTVSQKDFKQYFVSEPKRLDIETFSLSKAIPLPKENIASIQEYFVYPQAQITDLFTSLSTQRMLFLTGTAQSGKYFTAKYLCLRLMQEENPDYQLARIDSLESKMMIDPIKWIKHPKLLKKRILIFKDVFAKKNPFMLEFLRSCNNEQTDSLSTILKNLDAFILFTADYDTFDPHSLNDIPIKKDISPLDITLLESGFQMKLRRFCSLSPDRDHGKATQLFECRMQEILTQLGRMSKIALFIERYLDPLLKQEKTIDLAIEEVNSIEKHLSHWFLNELGLTTKTFETWTFALCLVLFNFSSYTDFNEIHRSVTTILLEILDPFQTLKEFTFSPSESKLLTQCHAQITKDMSAHADCIEFCDSQYQKTLLDILLKNNRKALLAIVPFLQEYVEKHRRPEQRRFAAISLARIGRIDPEAITLPIIEKWANQPTNLQRANVGFLYEGIIESGDEIYLTYCMRELQRMADSNNSSEQWTAIAAYKQIGLYDLPFAMEELRLIQEDILQRLQEKTNILDIVYSHTELLTEEQVLTNLDNIYEEADDLLSIIRYSILALSITLNSMDVLDEMRRWIDYGNSSSRVNVVLFFMGKDGILDELKDREVVYSSRDDQNKKEEYRCNLLLDNLATSEETVTKMARFLKALYKKCFSEFRADVKKILKKQLFDHMREWTVTSLDNTRINNSVKKLLVKFFLLGEEDLKDSLWDNIKSWKADKEQDEEKLKTFITDVAQQIYGDQTT